MNSLVQLLALEKVRQHLTIGSPFTAYQIMVEIKPIVSVSLGGTLRQSEFQDVVHGFMDQYAVPSLDNVERYTVNGVNWIREWEDYADGSARTYKKDEPIMVSATPAAMWIDSSSAPSPVPAKRSYVEKPAPEIDTEALQKIVIVHRIEAWVEK